MTAVPCPHCTAPVVFDESHFRRDDTALVETCGRCDGQVEITREPVAYRYRAEKG